MTGPAKPQQTMFDLTGSNKYTLDKFYTRSTDRNGHYEQVRVKLSPDMDAMARGIAGEFAELGSIESFIRDAIVHRLVYIRDHYDQVQTDLDAVHLEVLMAEMEKQKAKIEQRDGYVKLLEETIEALCGSRDWEGLVQALTDGDEVLAGETWPEGQARKLKDASDYGWTTLRTERRRKRVL